MTRTILTTVFAGLFFAVPGAVKAQKNTTDSIRYYQKQLTDLQQQNLKLLQASEPYTTLSGNLQRLQGLSKGYHSLSLYGAVSGANFNAFDKAIAQDGFPPLKGPIYAAGFGFSFKSNEGFMIDMNLGPLGFNKKSAYNGQTIKASYSGIQLDAGYAFVNTRVFDLYPYAGLGLRSATLDFKAPVTSNPGAASVASLVGDNRSYNGTATSLSYQAGVAIDLMIAENKKGLAGTILFAKFGTDGAFGPETYKYQGIPYNANIQYGGWGAQLGVKFFGRE